MAAILRSGKFLRIVSGLSRSGQQNQGPQSTTDNKKLENGGPLINITNSNTGAIQYHSLSLQQLQSALPYLSTNHEQDNKIPVEIPAEKFLERRGSDPLLEFYVDKQKIEEAAKNIKVVENNHVGLNIVNEIKDNQAEDEIRVEVKKSRKKKIPQTEEKIDTNEKTEIKVKEPINEAVVPILEDNDALLIDKINPLEVISEEIETVETQIPQNDNVQTPQPFEVPSSLATPDLVPLCEDPASHQWYPLPVVCQMFRAQGRIFDLESLLWGSLGIRPEDRKCIYYWTLQAYADCGMFPQAVDLTRRLEIEGLSTGFPEYHVLMNNFAMTTYQQQSSVVQSGSEVSSVHEPTPTPVPSITPDQSDLEQQQPSFKASHHYRKLKKAIANKDIESCLTHFKNIDLKGSNKDSLNVTESSTLIELFIKADLVQEAVEITETMLEREAYPLPRIFRFLLNRLASKGEVEAMTRIGEFLTPKIKKEVSYDNRLCNGYLAAGRASDYLDKLILELDQALAAPEDISDEKIQVLKDKFPRGGAMGLLESNPALVKPYTKLALQFVDLGYVAPVNVLWTYHFINGRHDLAQPLWDKHVRTCPQIMFQKVCQTARSTSNVDLAERLVILLENAVVTNGARGIAYSCLLDVLTQNKHYSKGLVSLDEGLKSGISLDDFNRTALRRLKEGVEEQGIDFPHEIPQKSVNSTNNGDFEEESIRSATPIAMIN